MSGLVLGQPDPPRTRLGARFAVFGLVVVLVVGLLTTRLFYLQVVQGGYYAGLAQDNLEATVPVPSARGLIYDRAGRPVAINVPSYVVRVRPADLPFSERDAVVAELSSLLNIPAPQIIEALDSYANQQFEQVQIASDVPSDVARIIIEDSRNLPGVDVSVDERREYEYGNLLADVLGYTGAVSPSDLSDLSGLGYLRDDQIGRAGVEATFEQQLRGVYGEQQVERDAAGRIVRTVDVTQQPQAGDSLELTLDVQIQREATEALQWATDIVHLQRGVVIVMNPQTGEIMAMVSQPTYDNNMFAAGISNADYQALLDNPNHPLINYAIGDQFPPGSTYKLVTGSGALMDGHITDTTQLQTAGFLQIGSYKYFDWNHKGFGLQDIYQGFGNSSDTFFFQLAADLGIDRLGYWANNWGFGEKTGIDLPSEVRGIVPTNDWKENVFSQPIYPGEVYQAGIGQGYDAATPLQLLNAYAALANGGSLYTPQIVRRVLAPDGSVVQDFQPELIRHLDVSPDVLTIMRNAARDVVTMRTTTLNLTDEPIVIAGKTGTAEFGIRDANDRLPYHTWFVGFVPNFTADQPGDPSKTDSQLAILAFAYESNTRGNAAVEIVKYFLQQHYHLGVDLTRPDLLQAGFEYAGH
jgi:penicillin-binding protein 2